MPVLTVLALVGTRPEAIKLAPVVLAARAAHERACSGWAVHLATTGQHDEVVRRALAVFDIEADHGLSCVRTTGSLHELLGVLVSEIGGLLESRPPAALIVQGDTSSAVAGTLAAFYQRIPVVHLEAGLTTRSIDLPFPEEAHRRLIAELASLHLAPTPRAAANLMARGVDSDRVVVTGNTVVDSLLRVVGRPPAAVPPDLAGALERAAQARARVVVVTAHRRESWGDPMARVASAVRDLADRLPDVHVVVVLHPNPQAAHEMRELVRGAARMSCVLPLEYDTFVHLLAHADLVLTDSGGLQEEMPSLGVPVVVLRDETERGEAVDAGWSVLSGTEPARIVHLAEQALHRGRRSNDRDNPFGDGRAAERVVQAISWFLGRGERPADYAVAAPRRTSG